MVDELRQHIGMKVRAARLRAGLTQEALAGSIGRTPESISNIERAEQLPGIDTVVDLAKALDVPIVEFFPETEAGPTSRARVELQARLMEAARSLTDRDLAVAVKQINAFHD